MKNIALAFPIMHLRAIAVVTAIALLAWTIGLPALIHKAQAGGLDTVSDVMSDTDLGLDSTHSVTFTTVTELTATDLIRITFDPTDGDYDFDFTSVAAADVASSTTHNVHTAIGSCAGPGTVIDFFVNNVDTTNDYIEYEVCTGDTVPAATEINFYIGATGATNYINNPNTAGSYVININTTDASLVTKDDADTRVAIIDDVLVTASVDTIFTFSIVGVVQGTSVNGDPIATTGTTTATTVPFGIVAPNTDYLLAQILDVSTNAQNGYAVTVFADQTLTAGNGATIDPFVDGAPVASTTPWVNPSGTLGNDLHYGHWGITSADDVVSSSTRPGLWGDGAVPWYTGNFVQNPVEVLYHDEPVLTTSGNGVGSTTVAYKLRITNLQEAAKDYTATLTYIATPVF